MGTLLTNTKQRRGFRFVPWRLSWKWFGLIFLIFFGVNFLAVRTLSKHPLLNPPQSDLKPSLESIYAALNDQSQEIAKLQTEIHETEITSTNQRATLLAMRKTLSRASADLSIVSKEADGLLHSNQQMSNSIENHRKALERISMALGDVKARVQRVRDGLKLDSKP